MHVVVNPNAGRGAVRRAWPAVEAVLRDGGVKYTASFTHAPGHAEQLARAAARDGARCVVAVGGDGTVHEVVNGLMDRDGPIDPGVMLGIVPSGTGCDTARTFGIPQRAQDAARYLLGDRTWGRLDVGRVRYRAPDGSERARWFVNIAEAGIGAQVVASAARMPRWMGGRAYRLAALRGIASFRPQPAHVDMHARKGRGVRVDAPLGPMTYDGTVTMIVVANGQFFGGGLHVAPRAIPSDAMLDVLIGEGSKADAVRALRKMPQGTHVPSTTISEYLADRIAITTNGLALEADGEALGETPATFDVFPEAIPLKI